MRYHCAHDVLPLNRLAYLNAQACVGWHESGLILQSASLIRYRHLASLPYHTVQVPTPIREISRRGLGMRFPNFLTASSKRRFFPKTRRSKLGNHILKPRRFHFFGSMISLSMVIMSADELERQLQDLLAFACERSPD